MGNQVNRPRGTTDILPGDVERWHVLENTAHQLCKAYNYSEIRTPIFEHTELFERGVGDATDIVQKEMYSFTGRGDRSLTLRPEGTASVVRAYVENKLYGAVSKPTKLYYIGPMFRYERPQAGRQRQFVQFGVEVLGSKDPAVDVEVMTLAMDFYQKLGLKNLKLVVNSLGDSESRVAYREALIKHFSPVIGDFCADCQKRLESNPLRILDCKVDRDKPSIQDAPKINDFYTEEAATYFKQVRQYLDALQIPYVVDATLVRGLDYYNHTAFEIMLDGNGFGAITTLCGGGRYNQLVEDLGGPETPGIGFALSIERALMALDAEKVALDINTEMDCFLVAMGEKAKVKVFELTHELRKSGIISEMDYMDRKMKAQLKEADRKQAKYVAILGEDELEKNIIQLKNMKTSEQEEISLALFVDLMKEKIGLGGA